MAKGKPNNARPRRTHNRAVRRNAPDEPIPSTQPSVRRASLIILIGGPLALLLFCCAARTIPGVFHAFQDQRSARAVAKEFVNALETADRDTTNSLWNRSYGVTPLFAYDFTGCAGVERSTTQRSIRVTYPYRGIVLTTINYATSCIRGPDSVHRDHFVLGTDADDAVYFAFST